MLVFLDTQEAEIRSRHRQIVCKTLPRKYPTQNRAGGVAQVVEYLPSKHETVSLNPSIIKNKQK
jgi:hypothetical protein